MILSESEALWMAEVMTALGHLEEWDKYFNSYHDSLSEEERNDLEERFYSSALYANYGHGDDGDAQPFPIIRRLAEDYGIGSIAVKKHSPGPEASPPADARWFSGGKLLTKHDLDRIIGKCNDLVNAIDRHVTFNGDEEQTAESIFSRISSRFDDFPIATGYSLSDAQTLYRLDCDGVVRKWVTVEACPRGLYSSLLHLLLPHMEVPVAVLMSLSNSSAVARERLLQWIPQYEDLFLDPQGNSGFSASKCYSVFVDFEHDNSSNEGWLLGKSLAQLREHIAELKGEVKHFFQCSSPPSKTEAEDESEQHGTLLSNENDHGGVDGGDQARGLNQSRYLAAREEDEEEADRYETTAAANQDEQHTSVGEKLLNYLLSWNDADPEGFLDLFPKQGLFGGYSLQQSRLLLAVYDLRKKFVALVDALQQRVENLQFQNIQELLQAAVSKVPHIEQLQDATKEGSPEYKRDSILKNLDDVMVKLNTASRIAYGELRLRGLKWDDASLPSRAIDGWAQQHQNLREAIRTGVTMLNNGAKVYPTLVSLKSPVESLIRQMRIKYLADVVPRPSINGTLHLLRERAKSEKDVAFLFMANTLQVLWELRCLIEHEPTRNYSRCHAVFLLNGLGLILEEGHFSGV